MSKDNKLQLHSPLFLKYQNDFEKNPRSRVFAPLAESYRKMGMFDKAMEVLSQGIRFHPSYTMGYLGLAFCYYDLGQFNLAYSTLIPLTESNRDNLRLQKLFSDTCMELGKQEEALETLKYLLFINPRNKEVAESVLKLEREVENRYKPHHKPIIIPEINFSTKSADLFNLDKLNQTKNSNENDFDNWQAKDLNIDSKLENGDLISNTEKLSTFDNWDVLKNNKILNPKLNIESEHLDAISDKFLEEIEEHQEDIREFNIEIKANNSLSETRETNVTALDLKNEHKAPLITHTLVDLYCGQGHIDKALIVLEKILLLNPNDQKTILKIKEIETLAHPTKYNENVEVLNLNLHEEAPLLTVLDISEEDGRRHLMSLIDEKLGPVENVSQIKGQTNKNNAVGTETREIKKNKRNEKVRRIEEKLSLFLKKIQKRALDYQVSV